MLNKNEILIQGKLDKCFPPGEILSLADNIFSFQCIIISTLILSKCVRIQFHFPDVMKTLRCLFSLSRKMKSLPFYGGSCNNTKPPYRNEYTTASI